MLIQAGNIVREATPEEQAALLASYEKVKRNPVKEEVLSSIAALEAKITPRRQREAILGTDNGWLANVDAQIAALRAQL